MPRDGGGRSGTLRIIADRPRARRVDSSYPLVVHHVPRPSRAGGRLPALLAPLAAVLVGVVVLAGCAAAAPPSFDPSAPCTVDVRIPGAYPTLEALVPPSLDGRPPARLDSGRNCTTTNLTTLADRGISELRFAGGLWESGSAAGVTLAVFEADGLTAADMGEWYEAGARVARRTQALKPSRPLIDGRQGYRLDLLNGDVPQSVIVWPSADGRVVQVVIGASVPESQIQAAITAFR